MIFRAATERHYTWSVGIVESGDLLRFRAPRGVRNPVLTRRSVTDFPCAFVADPFWVSENGGHYLFFEALNRQTKRGEICVAQSADGRRWRYRGSVLREPFHLSYPFVFQEDGQWYMAPESGTENAVILYRAASFPDRWEREATLLEGAPYNDASIVFFEGRWWLFAGNRPFIDDTLCLFYSDKLKGPWKPHAKNPVVSGDASRARPGGRPVVKDGRLIRFAQNDAPYYGRGIRTFEITRLTPEIYEETERGPVRFEKARLADDGAHHLDAHPDGHGGWQACMDGFRWKHTFIGWKKFLGIGPKKVDSDLAETDA